MRKRRLVLASVKEFVSIIFLLLLVPLSIRTRLFLNWCRRNSINILMSPDVDQTNMALLGLLNTLTTATYFASSSSWSLTNELILKAIVDVTLVHQRLEKYAVTWCRFCFSSIIASSNRLKSISLFWPYLRKFGILQNNRMLVDFKTYLLP